MAGLCKIPTCIRLPFAICNCCQQNICKFHIDEHWDKLNSELELLTDDINGLSNEIKVFDMYKTNSESREKLEQWRVECYQKIDHLFEKKSQELDQCIIEKIAKQTEEINFVGSKLTVSTGKRQTTRQDVNFLTSAISQLKEEMNNIEHTYIQIKTSPLLLTDSMLTVTETIRPKIDLLTLPSTCKTINHSNKSFCVLASNNKFVLLHQELNLCLVDLEMNIVKKALWSYNIIIDMCWSSTLDQFILINENDLFLVDDNLTCIEKVNTIANNKWSSCTCSNTSLFLSTNEFGSSIHEFNLLPEIEFVRQWQYPVTCKKTEKIDSIVYNNGTLALMVRNPYEKSIRIELRFSATLDRLWSLALDMICNKKITFHCCPLSFDEWLVADYDKCRLLHITKCGQIKAVIKYKSPPYHINLFNQNILVIFTKSGKNLYQLV